MGINQFLPDTGRGTMRSMVEGRRAAPFHGAPSTTLRVVPLPLQGRN